MALSCPSEMKMIFIFILRSLCFKGHDFASRRRFTMIVSLKYVSIPFVYIIVFILCLAVSACDHSPTKLNSSSSLAGSSTAVSNNDTDKGDNELSPFPAERDLAIIIPQYRAIYPALSIIKEEWLDEVELSLFESEIRQNIRDESLPEDWSLVAIRVSPCSPLGHVADPVEIDRLCWPEVRLVLQPIKQLRRPSGSTFLFPDDRAIHALYRVERQNSSLTKITTLIQQGLRLNDIDPSTLAEFEQARDQVAIRLLNAVKKTRVTQDIYHRIAERPEFFDSETENKFWETLNDSLIEIYCLPNSLYHLTAMSLPLGRRPVPLDLWSFVAFDAFEGTLERADLKVRDRVSGEIFFSFKEDLNKWSEDVSASRGDPKMIEYYSQRNPEERTQLSTHTILDHRQIPRRASQIIDPYQTLVAHTTCSSCHRFNDTLFNFHNLSYFGDQEMSVSPRVEADVSRELDWVKALIERTQIEL